ncbi:sensor histidine kinase [Herbidospora daliensis]|uniref:sensor histidine kinase n=1 Tax=Herbidospora daliensis TaxID=295585 RepID=UPI000A90A1A8|nr:HAMP domain-containing sensor histidine kinase [Herbidospora daliensis]
MKEARRVWPGGSIRARMTLLYGGIFTTVALGVLLAAQQIQQIIVGQKVQDSPFVGNPGTAPLHDPAALAKAQADLERTLINSQRVVTVVTLVLITVLAFAVCFWLTGRLLRPVHRITTTARRLSLSTLHERIALTGPRDELKELADTFDAMLDRLEQAVDSQRRFVANASHELRTPLTIQRTAIEVGLADPTPEKVARIRAELLRNTLRSERLIEGLLVLAQGERGLDAHLPVELETVVEQVIEDHLPLAVRHGVALDVRTKPVVVSGDEVLLGRLAANLVHNAIRHNHPGGHVTVELSSDAVLTVRNSGPRVPPERVAELFQPFRRLNADRTGSADGAGLGLSIVAALVHAHGGVVRAQAQPEGGLAVTVTLPAA